MIDGPITPLDHDYLARIAESALQEDIGPGDLTTESLIDPTHQARAQLIAGETMVLAGLEIFQQVFRHLDADAVFTLYHGEGEAIEPGTVILEVSGRAQAIFKGERTALNFMQHLSGIATRTRLFLERLEGLPVRLLDTRKTVPGLRQLEKHAVRVAGGGNHRFGLFDGILIKDNHRAVIHDLGAALAHLRSLFPLRRVEVECASMAEVEEALAARADILLLDNMTPEELTRAVALVNGRCLLEASGRVNLGNLREVAQTGVDFISAGTIIHGATFIDLSLEFVPGGRVAGA